MFKLSGGTNFRLCFAEVRIDILVHVHGARLLTPSSSLIRFSSWPERFILVSRVRCLPLVSRVLLKSGTQTALYLLLILSSSDFLEERLGLVILISAQIFRTPTDLRQVYCLLFDSGAL